MAPKKKVAGKKKDNPESGGELDAETKAKMFLLACQSLQVQLGIDIIISRCNLIFMLHSRKDRRI